MSNLVVSKNINKNRSYIAKANWVSPKALLIDNIVCSTPKVTFPRYQGNILKLQNNISKVTK